MPFSGRIATEIVTDPSGTAPSPCVGRAPSSSTSTSASRPRLAAELRRDDRARRDPGCSGWTPARVARARPRIRRGPGRRRAPATSRRIAAAGGVDVQLLGIGANGHIGFNEPTSSFASRTRIKTLAPRTREDNARFFGGDLDAVPLHLHHPGARHDPPTRGGCCSWRRGRGRRTRSRSSVEGPLSAYAGRGSALQLHPHATVLLDEAAASRLALARPRTRGTYAAKPEWPARCDAQDVGRDRVTTRSEAVDG